MEITVSYVMAGVIKSDDAAAAVVSRLKYLIYCCLIDVKNMLFSKKSTDKQWKV